MKTEFTATQCCAGNEKEKYVHAFVSPNSKMTQEDRVEFANAKKDWRQSMRLKMPDFKKRRYKYILLTTVIG